MYFITDTCFWTHIKEISDNIAIDLRSEIALFKWGLTNAVKSEITHYIRDDWVPIADAYLCPLSKTEYQTAIRKYTFITELDVADQEVICLAKRENALILTDDGSLATTANAMGIDVLRVPDFVIFLSHNNYIDKKQATQILTFFRSIKRYKQRELDRWCNELKKR